MFSSCDVVKYSHIYCVCKLSKGGCVLTIELWRLLYLLTSAGLPDLRQCPFLACATFPPNSWVSHSCHHAFALGAGDWPAGLSGPCPSPPTPAASPWLSFPVHHPRNFLSDGWLLRNLAFLLCMSHHILFLPLGRPPSPCYPRTAVFSSVISSDHSDSHSTDHTFLSPTIHLYICTHMHVCIHISLHWCIFWQYNSSSNCSMGSGLEETRVGLGSPVRIPLPKLQ